MVIFFELHIFTLKLNKKLVELIYGLNMIRIPRPNGNNVYVFENEQEAVKYDVVNIDPIEAQPGDYLLSGNGYYVPVLNLYTHENKRTILHILYMPLNHKLSYHYYKKSKKYSPVRSFIFDRNGKPHPMTYVSPNAKMLIKLVKEGVSLVNAVTMCYSVDGSRRTVLGILNRLIRSKPFVELFIKEVKMDLADKLKNNGLDEDFLFKITKEIITDKKENSKIRQQAYEFAIAINMTNIKQQQNSTSKLINNDNNDFYIDKYKNNDPFNTDKYLDSDNDVNNKRKLLDKHDIK